METRFGYDFSNVRIHADAQAGTSVRAVNALAYTLGQHIVFAPDSFAPHTRVGQRLLAHELTHVIQQQRHALHRVQCDLRHGTESMHHELAEEQRRQAGLQPGEGPSDAEIIYVNVLSTVPDLPFFMVERLRPACQPTAMPPQRQAAVAELVTWARSVPSLGVDWSRIDFVRFDTSAGALGSSTDANDPDHIKILIGPDAFASVSDLYSTFRHELVHAAEHETRPRSEVFSRGWGVQEVYAYLWELEHQQQTGLSRRANWGLTPAGAADTGRGLARVLDGLLRSLQRLNSDLQQNRSRISQDELLRIERRVACAMTATPAQVVRAVFPPAPLQQWQRECAAGVAAPQPKVASGTSGMTLGAADSAAEREADDVASRVVDGGMAPTISEAPSAVVARAQADAGSLDDGAVLMRQPQSPAGSPQTQPEFSELEPQYREYGGCQDPSAIRGQRADAARLAAHAVELLEGNDLRRVATLLMAHFHLDPGRSENRADIDRIHGQLVRMRDALNSRIRILCRAAPRTMGLPPARMPTSPECRPNVLAYSTSCAAGNPSSTVMLCELGLIEMGRPLVMTILHEFAHIACNGNPPVSPAGRETYYRGSLPGQTANVLTEADSYAWFAMDAGSIESEERPQQRPGTGRTLLERLGRGLVGLLAGAATLGAVGAGVGALAGALLPGVGALLGAGVGAAIGAGIGGVAGAFTGAAT